MNFWKRDAKTAKILKLKNEVIRGKWEQHRQSWKEWKLTFTNVMGTCYTREITGGLREN